MKQEEEILKNWAETFGLEPALFQEAGTQWAPREQDTEAFGIHIWHIGRRSVVRADPSLAAIVRQLSEEHPLESLRQEHVLATLPAERVRKHSMARLWYLDRDADMKPAVPEDADVRPLTSADAAAMTILHEACSREEAAEAYVEVAHEVGFGAFEGCQLLAAATGYDFSGFMDLGVLTHPDARRRGLGAATVAAAVRVARERGMIPQYRHADWNVASAGIPSRLGFERWSWQSSVWMHRD